MFQRIFTCLRGCLFKSPSPFPPLFPATGSVICLTRAIINSSLAELRLPKARLIVENMKA